jgi:hypothetical protein
MKIKLFEGFVNEGGMRRHAWAFDGVTKSKINEEINNVLIELVDNGFEIEIDHFAKKIAEQNSILVSVHKVTNNEVFNTNEVKDNIEVLLAYMGENYGVISYDYNTEIIGAWPNNRGVAKEYPDNLDVIEIDVDITI